MQDNNNANAKDQFVKWLDKYVKSDKEQAKDLHNNFISVIKDATNSTEDKIRYIAQIKYTGEVQPITSEDYNQLIDEYIKQVSEFIVIDFSSYTLADFKNVIQIFNSQYLIMYMYQIRTKALDLYIKDIREQHTLKVLNTLADLQNQEILKNTDYKTFIYTDLEELISKYNLNCIIDKSALLQVQQSLKKDAENLSESERQKFLAGDTLKLTDSDNTYNLKMLFTILVMEYQKPFTEDLINRDFKANKDYYKTRHQKLQKLDTLLKQATKKMESTEQFIKDNQKSLIAVNTIPKSYNYIDNMLQKSLTLIENKQPKAIDLMLDTGDKKRHKKRLNTPIIVKIDNNGNVIENTDNKVIDQFTGLVLTRAFSIWQVNKTHIDPELIYKDITGKDLDKTQIGYSLYESIANALEILSTSRIALTIDDPLTIERLGLNEDDINNLSIEEYILPLNRATISYKNGTQKVSYTYMKEPIYYTIAKRINQIKSIPRQQMQHLLIESKYSVTQDRILIVNYILNQLKVMQSNKNNKQYSNVLLYDTILNKCELLKDIDPTSKKYRTKKSNYVKYINTMIEECKRNQTIKGYTLYPSNKKRKTGFTILL